MGQEKEERSCNVVSLVGLQGLCGAAVVAGVKTVPALWGLNLITQPVQTLQIAAALTAVVIFAAYTWMAALSPNTRSVWQSAGCGLLSLPVGAVVAVLIALAFGAPTSLEFASRTWHWGCFMSVLVAVPSALILGNSWSEWQRVFAFTRDLDNAQQFQTKPRGGVELAVCVPAHGAALGAWVGAWPMPLDWERPWQEWPICCTYGAVGGYLLGLTASVVVLLFHSRRVPSKQD